MTLSRLHPSADIVASWHLAEVLIIGRNVCLLSETRLTRNENSQVGRDASRGSVGSRGLASKAGAMSMENSISECPMPTWSWDCLYAHCT